MKKKVVQRLNLQVQSSFTTATSGREEVLFSSIILFNQHSC
jgi:hypothetical protein